MKKQVRLICLSEVVRPSSLHSQTTKVRFATQEKLTTDARKTESISKVKDTIENPLIMKRLQEKQVGVAHKTPK